jgi:putative endonuclease
MYGWVYILECCDGSFYVESTINLIKRIVEHRKGKGSNFTKDRLPVKLVYIEWYKKIGQAYRRERQIHGWSRKKKRALINYRIDLLIEYSRNSSFLK